MRLWAIAGMLVAVTVATADTEYTITGKIKGVSKAGEVVVARTNGKETTLLVARDTSFSIDEQTATLNQLAKGQEVRAVYWLESKKAINISAFVELDIGRSGPLQPSNEYGIDGKVKVIDLKGQRLTVARANGKTTTVLIGKGTAVHLDGKPVQAARILADQEVRVWYEFKSKVATNVFLFVETDRPGRLK